MKLKAIVKRKRRIRVGKGFSKDELKAAGLSVKQALEMGIPVDVRRSTMHEENVEALKSFLAETMKGKEALGLREVPGIGEKRAQQLKDIGIDSVEKLAKSSPKVLSEKLKVSERTASRWISSAKEILSS
ncbi:ribosomal protein L13e [Candidatus Bathyarchaeota archaeon]|nr:ribosomal protein L13e [Candidatus Bathyarchaeota archaeon]